MQNILPTDNIPNKRAEGDGFYNMLNLRDLREQKGLSQLQVATLAGISKNYYSRIERGERNCSVWVAKKIGAALKLKKELWVDLADRPILKPKAK